MSAGLPYLRSLRKSDLVVLAETANLQEYVKTRARCSVCI
jgi:hypothetical protein